MKKLLYILVAAAMAIVAAPMAINLAQPVVAAEPAKVEPAKMPVRADLPSAVKVMVAGDHGSAVHIGNGYFLTACHVAKNATANTKFKLADDSVRPAETLWCNEAYDIALMRAKADGIAASKLSCVVPAVGDELTVAGNPLILENITAYARVAGNERKLGKWRSVIVVDGATVPGQSGGPAYNKANEVVGITVGVVLWPQSPFAAVTTGYGTVVPGKAVCELLARI